MTTDPGRDPEMPLGAFPRQRPRRLRRTTAIREMVSESHLGLDHLIQAHFLLPGSGKEEAIESLPGISRYSIDRLLPRVEADLKRGLRAVMLFGLPEHKDASGRGAEDPEGPIPLAIRALEQQFGDELVVMSDVCLCPYTDHGHCGLIEGEQIANDATLERLVAMSITHAEAGADFVCPSDMMDGRIGAIRAGFERAGHADTGILAYSVKYASAYYGPFRDAADSAPSFGDRRSYQMDPRNRREALRELELDVAEGADLVMVKPALAYLDVLSAVAAAAPVPVVAYNVSGEYAMVKLAAQAGLADERQLTLETLGAIRRAGADLIVSYHGSQLAERGWLNA